jgi:predicted anti-sigma-YlaC factor YlaD
MVLRNSPGDERACARTREWISLDLDGELSEVERASLTRHLARCADCGAFAVAAAQVARIVRETPLAVPSRPLAPALEAVHLDTRRRMPLRLKTAAIAALVAAAALSGVTVGAYLGDGEERAQQNSGPTVIADLQPEDVPVRPRPVMQTANV